MDEKEQMKARVRADLQLQANQALTRIRGLLAERNEQWVVLADAQRKLAELDTQDGTYNAVADAAAQLD